MCGVMLLPSRPDRTAPNWDHLAAEVDRLNRADPHAALAAAEAWLDAERASASAEGYARALRARAHAFRFLGEYETAVVEYDNTVARFNAIGLDGEAMRTRIGEVTALRFLGRYQQAIELAQQGRAYFLEHRDELQAAKQIMNLGTIYRPMGRLMEALRAYRDARAVFRRLGQWSSVADAEQNLGNVLVDLGRYQQALGRLRTAERIRRKLGLRTELALANLNIGALSSRRGDYGRALKALSEARQVYESVGVASGVTAADLYLLETYNALNLREEAIAAADRAIAGLGTLGMPLHLGRALLAVGELAQRDGDQVLARRRTRQARQLFRRTGNPLWEAMAQLQEARLAITGDNVTKYRAVLSQCQTSIHRLEAAGSVDQATMGHVIRGVILTRLGEREEALACLRRALEVATSLGADHLRYQAHAAVGELLEPTDSDTALANYRLAIHHLEAVRARALADDLKLSLLADKTDFYERPIGLLIRRGSPMDVSEAQGLVERAKSRTLLEELLSRASGVDRHRQSRTAKLRHRAYDLRARLNAAYALAYGAEGSPSRNGARRSDRMSLVVQLEREFARANREFQLAARVEPDDLVGALESGDAAVPATTALVQFYAVGGKLIAFVKTDSGLQLRHLSSLDEVARLSEHLRIAICKADLGLNFLRANSAKLRQGVDNALHGLWKAIIAPLEADLTGHPNLIVLPHGLLHGLPFHAFHDGDDYLAARFTVTYAPSIGVYQYCLSAAKPIGERAVIVGVEDTNLAWMRREIETVGRSWPRATVLTGRRATGRALRRLAGKFDVLHVATHAMFRADNPQFSALQLADGWLTGADLADVVRGAQLVTLSACETARAGPMARDEVMGLTQAILGAGCPMVIASLWPVSDESTALLMGRFYSNLREEVEPAEALRSAILQLRTEYDHPYCWAPFAAIGAGRRRTTESSLGDGA